LTISTSALRHLVITITVKKLRLGFGAGSYQHNLLCWLVLDGATIAHECTLNRHPGAKVQVLTVPEWEGRTKLTVPSLYAFQVELESFSRKHLEFAGIKAPLRCSGEKNIKKWLRRFFHEAGAKFTGWDKKCSVDAALYHCDEVEGAPMKMSERSHVLIVTVVRKLRCEEWLKVV
jgi:hypothetical protein